MQESSDNNASFNANRVFPLPGGDESLDLRDLLQCWDKATARLQETHESLRKEVTRLTDELEVKNRELARKNRLADLGLVASHIAHEVRNGLMPLTLYTGMLKRNLGADQESARVIGKIESGLTVLNTTVDDLLHFTADRQPNRSYVPTSELIREVCEDLAPQLQAQEVQLRLDLTDRDMLLSDKDMLKRAFLNLTLNALDVMPKGGILTITSQVNFGHLEIEFADTGCGITSGDVRRIFDPFFSTKSTGTGLGLAIVQRVMEVHEGQVSAMNCPDFGAAFTLMFPIKAMKAAA
ncbi:sensor histidine kinase [Bremerella cremea]|uniref:histidine kinase n=1 Tax=Blastopirellula marina TaxID=124 RepID=A0A2S8FRP0_9BACT|nr:MULTISPECIES: ATP-binding protein [Pirellulaceae]PQO34845.1 two-component sensor histidine kinase [Blastopirellula marina]RCS47345.1 sensor histidine kinase [Bremerella cremea]